ncbi:hypothetical protein GCM10009809_38170 [Isoptericola hypogeus]|uniref:Uncharacterized protein n=1 Tax=Isoptericola hypogeus TaxID=300179 RepID=A0ABN2JU89_9MICO
MDLNARITAKLDAGIDAHVFERCAVALMANHYETVVPIEGGSDGGRDGDIIAPIADTPDSRGRILVTTGDALDNLKSSHRTWKKFWAAGETFRIDQLVMVTSKSLSDAKRRNIETYCRTHDLPVPHIYSRQWLVDSLRRHSDLRVELTGVEGRLEALTTKPPELVPSTGLFGRDEDVERLRGAVASATDVSLSGVPGVGKSRLLMELEGSVHFVDRLGRDHLADDLITMDPSIVVLDDAHIHLELLEQVVSIRSKERLSFTIVAATWPGSEAQVEELLNDPVRVVVDRLARAALDEIIQALGVYGFRVRVTVLEQSDGRPGWAVALSRLVVDGAGEEFAAGQSLLDQVAVLTRAIAGNAVLNEALAWIAALGAANLEDIEVVASHAGVPYADLIAWLEATAQGGLVERTGDAWSVLAPLRPLIVAATFFGARKTRTWASIAAKFPGDARMDRAVLDVASRVPDATVQALANAWFARISTMEVDELPLDLAEVYSGINEASADRAAVLARAVLGAPRETQLLFGNVTYDPVGNAAQGILRMAFRRSCCREAARGLFDLALEDHRPRHQHPEHPMRVIQDMAHYLDPDHGPLDDLRERILEYALEWFEERPDEARWEVFSEVARYVFDPSVEGNWSDPGSHLTLTMSRGVMAPESMSSLIALWSKVDSRVRGHLAVRITHRAAAQLCEVFDAWSRLAAGVSNAGSTTAEHGVVALEGAALVLDTLRVLAERFRALPIRVNRQLALASMRNGGSISLEVLPIDDDRLARFAGVREPEDDIDAWMAERRDQHTSLAREFNELTAVEGVAEFRRLVSECSMLEGNHEGDQFAGLLSVNLSDPYSWLEAAIEAHVPALVGPFIARARADGTEVDDLVRLALEIPELRPIVVRAVIQEDGELDDLAHSVIESLTDDDVPMIADLWIRESVTPTLRKLLVHPRAAVRAVAAVSFGFGARGHGPALPDELRPAWRAALVEAVPGQLPQHSQWRLGQMLKLAIATDPQLCADWFIMSSRTTGLSLGSTRPVESLAEVLRALPQDQKRRIVATLGTEALVSSGFASEVLGSDAELAKDLLAEGHVDGPTLLRSMSGERDHTVDVLGPALVAAQVPARQIVAAALSSRSWSGTESAAILKDLDFFGTLSGRRPELAEVCALAAELLSRELEVARSREEQDRRRGW